MAIYSCLLSVQPPEDGKDSPVVVLTRWDLEFLENAGEVPFYRSVGGEHRPRDGARLKPGSCQPQHLALGLRQAIWCDGLDLAGDRVVHDDALLCDAEESVAEELVVLDTVLDQIADALRDLLDELPRECGELGLGEDEDPDVRVEAVDFLRSTEPFFVP